MQAGQSVKRKVIAPSIKIEKKILVESDDNDVVHPSSRSLVHHLKPTYWPIERVEQSQCN